MAYFSIVVIVIFVVIAVLTFTTNAKLNNRDRSLGEGSPRTTPGNSIESMPNNQSCQERVPRGFIIPSKENKYLSPHDFGVMSATISYLHAEEAIETTLLSPPEGQECGEFLSDILKDNYYMCATHFMALSLAACHIYASVIITTHPSVLGEISRGMISGVENLKKPDGGIAFVKPLSKMIIRWVMLYKDAIENDIADSEDEVFSPYGGAVTRVFLEAMCSYREMEISNVDPISNFQISNGLNTAWVARIEYFKSFIVPVS